MHLINPVLVVSARKTNPLLLLDVKDKKKGDKPSYCPIGLAVNIV